MVDDPDRGLNSDDMLRAAREGAATPPPIPADDSSEAPEVQSEATEPNLVVEDHGATRYLVVAHQTADSVELVETVRDLAKKAPDSQFWLVVPATPIQHLATWTEGEGHAAASRQAAAAKEALIGAGANVIEAIVGDASPVAAVQDALLRRDYDTIVISTLPPKASRWLRMDVIHRLERVVTVPVIHVIAHSHG